MDDPSSPWLPGSAGEKMMNGLPRHDDAVDSPLDAKLNNLFMKARKMNLLPPAAAVTSESLDTAKSSSVGGQLPASRPDTENGAQGSSGKATNSEGRTSVSAMLREMKNQLEDPEEDFLSEDDVPQSTNEAAVVNGDHKGGNPTSFSWRTFGGDGEGPNQIHVPSRADKPTADISSGLPEGTVVLAMDQLDKTKGSSSQRSDDHLFMPNKGWNRDTHPNRLDLVREKPKAADKIKHKVSSSKRPHKPWEPRQQISISQLAQKSKSTSGPSEGAAGDDVQGGWVHGGGSGIEAAKASFAANERRQSPSSGSNTAMAESIGAMTDAQRTHALLTEADLTNFKPLLERSRMNFNKLAKMSERNLKLMATDIFHMNIEQSERLFTTVRKWTTEAKELVSTVEQITGSAPNAWDSNQVSLSPVDAARSFAAAQSFESTGQFYEASVSPAASKHSSRPNVNGQRYRDISHSSPSDPVTESSVTTRDTSMQPSSVTGTSAVAIPIASTAKAEITKLAALSGESRQLLGAVQETCKGFEEISAAIDRQRQKAQVTIRDCVQQAMEALQQREKELLSALDADAQGRQGMVNGVTASLASHVPALLQASDNLQSELNNVEKYLNPLEQGDDSPEVVGKAVTGMLMAKQAGTTVKRSMSECSEAWMGVASGCAQFAGHRDVLSAFISNRHQAAAVSDSVDGDIHLAPTEMAGSSHVSQASGNSRVVYVDPADVVYILRKGLLPMESVGPSNSSNELGGGRDTPVSVMTEEAPNHAGASLMLQAHRPTLWVPARGKGPVDIRADAETAAKMVTAVLTARASSGLPALVTISAAGQVSSDILRQPAASSQDYSAGIGDDHASETPADQQVVQDDLTKFSLSLHTQNLASPSSGAHHVLSKHFSSSHKDVKVSSDRRSDRGDSPRSIHSSPRSVGSAGPMSNLSVQVPRPSPAVAAAQKHMSPEIMHAAREAAESYSVRRSSRSSSLNGGNKSIASSPAASFKQSSLQAPDSGLPASRQISHLQHEAEEGASPPAEQRDDSGTESEALFASVTGKLMSSQETVEHVDDPLQRSLSDGLHQDFANEDADTETFASPHFRQASVSSGTSETSAMKAARQLHKSKISGGSSGSLHSDRVAAASKALSKAEQRTWR